MSRFCRMCSYNIDDESNRRLSMFPMRMALAATLTVASASPSAASGLDGLKLRTPALVTGLVPARDGREHSTLLRLLEIGFVPGETVQVLARGAWGGDPLAVRVGQATFALRHQEAAMVQVQTQGQS